MKSLSTASGVSVVIPSCDRPDSLARSLASVARQTLAPVEVLVVDNGVEAVPIDLQEAHAFATFLRLPPRAGVSVARNQGALRAIGPFIAFLDDDDTWPDDYLEVMVAQAQAEGLDMVAAPIVVGPREKIWPVPVARQGVVPAWRHNGYGGSNILVGRQAFWEVGGFSSRLTTGEDRALFVEFVLHSLRVGVCAQTYSSAIPHPGARLTNNSTLLLGKLEFLALYGERMDRRARREDRFASLVYLSRAWRFPFWFAGALAYPDVAWRRLVRRTLPSGHRGRSS